LSPFTEILLNHLPQFPVCDHVLRIQSSRCNQSGSLRVRIAIEAPGVNQWLIDLKKILQS
jgi:hypothetical protein